ncbi:DUF5623 domain-containing protein [Sphingomonas sp. MMSM20]|uniref:DUF5623 domain-containing protein n=1 Tax=Sphingomonas lycopersici TaxID=2951807 RepID=UPI002237438C|nr:DUF5623 domain-containing protein [Sphingomonas lycopersici]MCW6530796.1 DUF5623 domain-containing protein [Sphingomonas lycopersici]
MLIGDVRPTTLDGVKSLAAQLRREQGIKHSNALDIAARAANCTNFRNARKVLPARGSALERPYVLLTIYWCDKDKHYQVGRETLRIELAQPILQTCSKFLLKEVRGFERLRMVAADHFVSDTIVHTQDYARDRISTAERSLRFMERTGLRPSRDHRKGYPGGSPGNKMPNADHSSDWVDADSGQVIVVDEPYSGVPDEDKRAAWAMRHNWRVARTSWPGMYFPYSCDLYVATDGATGYDFDALVAKINAMPAPLVVEDWAGESVPSWETFVSPMAKTPQDTRRARCRGMIYPIDSATTVPYSYNMGSSRRRPKGELGVEGHIEVGRMIKAVLSSRERPFSVYRRMNSVRSTLEDWMNKEIGRGQLEGPEFFDVYYHELEDEDPLLSRAASRVGLIAILGILKQKLQAAYPDCAPLRSLLNSIDMSVKMIDRMKPARA